MEGGDTGTLDYNSSRARILQSCNLWISNLFCKSWIKFCAKIEIFQTIGKPLGTIILALLASKLSVAHFLVIVKKKNERKWQSWWHFCPIMIVLSRHRNDILFKSHQESDYNHNSKAFLRFGKVFFSSKVPQYAPPASQEILPPVKQRSRIP